MGEGNKFEFISDEVLNFADSVRSLDPEVNSIHLSVTTDRCLVEVYEKDKNICAEIIGTITKQYPFDFDTEKINVVKVSEDLYYSVIGFMFPKN